MYDNISNKYIQNSIVPKQTFVQIEEGIVNIKYIDFNIEPNNIKKIYISKRKYIEFCIYDSNIPLLVLSHINLWN